MLKPDDKLRTLLRAWPGIEPDARFEDRVRQRVQARALPVRTGFRGYPAWAAAAAILLAAAAGVLAGATASRSSTREAAVHPLLQSRLLAGAYLAASTGAGP